MLKSVSNMENNFISRREHDEFVKRMEDEHARTNKRFAVFEKTTEQMQELINNMGIMATNMKYMIEEQRTQGERLERLENVPLNSWNSIKTAMLASIGTAIGGAITAMVLYFI